MHFNYKELKIFFVECIVQLVLPGSPLMEPILVFTFQQFCSPRPPVLLHKRNLLNGLFSWFDLCAVYNEKAFIPWKVALTNLWHKNPQKQNRKCHTCTRAKLPQPWGSRENGATRPQRYNACALYAWIYLCDGVCPERGCRGVCTLLTREQYTNAAEMYIIYLSFAGARERVQNEVLIAPIDIRLRLLERNLHYTHSRTDNRLLVSIMTLYLHY